MNTNLLFQTFLTKIFVVLVVIFYLIYKPLKYKDDGRDVVNWLDFVTIHMTFPAINVWASYQLYYSILITVTTMCDSSYIGAESSSYCTNYHLLDSKKDE